MEAAGGWAHKEKSGPGWRQRAGGHKGGEGQHLGTHRSWVGCGGRGHGKGRVVTRMLCSLALAVRLTTSDRVG